MEDYVVKDGHIGFYNSGEFVDIELVNKEIEDLDLVEKLKNIQKALEALTDDDYEILRENIEILSEYDSEDVYLDEDD